MNEVEVVVEELFLLDLRSGGVADEVEVVVVEDEELLEEFLTLNNALW